MGKAPTPSIEGTFLRSLDRGWFAGASPSPLSHRFSSPSWLMGLHSHVIKVNKIQETSTLNLISCLKRYFNFDLTRNEKPKSGKFIQNCTEENLDNIFKELYKRFIVPFYIPILILSSLCLIIKSKENINFTKYRLIIFLIGFGFIIFSETTLKYIQNIFYLNLKIFILSIIFLLIIYLLMHYLTQKNFKVIK